MLVQVLNVEFMGVNKPFKFNCGFVITWKSVNYTLSSHSVEKLERLGKFVAAKS